MAMIKVHLKQDDYQKLVMRKLEKNFRLTLERSLNCNAVFVVFVPLLGEGNLRCHIEFYLDPRSLNISREMVDEIIENVQALKDKNRDILGGNWLTVFIDAKQDFIFI